MIVRLYDPHPGYGGALIPLPGAIKDVVDALDGTTLPLGEAVAKIREAAESLDYYFVDVEAKAHRDYKFISVMLYDGSLYHEGSPYPAHGFRVISYEEADG